MGLFYTTVPSLASSVTFSYHPDPPLLIIHQNDLSRCHIPLHSFEWQLSKQVPASISKITSSDKFGVLV